MMRQEFLHQIAGPDGKILTAGHTVHLQAIYTTNYNSFFPFQQDVFPEVPARQREKGNLLANLRTEIYAEVP